MPSDHLLLISVPLFVTDPIIIAKRYFLQLVTLKEMWCIFQQKDTKGGEKITVVTKTSLLSPSLQYDFKLVSAIFKRKIKKIQVRYSEYHFLPQNTVCAHSCQNVKVILLFSFSWAVQFPFDNKKPLYATYSVCVHPGRSSLLGF